MQIDYQVVGKEEEEEEGEVRMSMSVYVYKKKSGKRVNTTGIASLFYILKLDLIIHPSQIADMYSQ